jgi:predicted house-cleaning noncanonical NTP pyrophosphatase (MazG superfamily)
MNQLLLLTKNNITETMSNSNWKKEIYLNPTNYINSLESKMKEESKLNENHIWDISFFDVIKRDPYMDEKYYDVIESKMSSKVIEFYNSQTIQDMQFELNNLEKRNEMNPAKNYLNSNNFSLSTKGVCYR